MSWNGPNNFVGPNNKMSSKGGATNGFAESFNCSEVYKGDLQNMAVALWGKGKGWNTEYHKQKILYHYWGDKKISYGFLLLISNL